MDKEEQSNYEKQYNRCPIMVELIKIEGEYNSGKLSAEKAYSRLVKLEKKYEIFKDAFREKFDGLEMILSEKMEIKHNTI